MEVLAQYGTPEQQRQLLGPLLAGEVRSSFSMTEPEVASSDATNLGCDIRREGDSYVINGRKWFTSGTLNEDCRLLIVMDPWLLLRSRRALAAVDDPGPQIDARGAHRSDAPVGHPEIVYENVRVPVENMLLDEGRGFEIAQSKCSPELACRRTATSRSPTPTHASCAWALALTRCTCPGSAKPWSSGTAPSRLRQRQTPSCVARRRRGCSRAERRLMRAVVQAARGAQHAGRRGHPVAVTRRRRGDSVYVCGRGQLSRHTQHSKQVPVQADAALLARRRDCRNCRGVCWANSFSRRRSVVAPTIQPICTRPSAQPVGNLVPSATPPPAACTDATSGPYP